ncbi:glycosyltransferase 87 family protein [Streptomyces sp. NBC_00838]|uniref:glycosyltransferase 87 family protein n=1 Tax=Streptomyces sp. NBC_00838 TaxID=2903680 RepID=UPI003869D627|nr:glycosyltransferase 87 family protein [Streptomyces sp. NBC_00838]
MTHPTVTVRSLLAVGALVLSLTALTALTALCPAQYTLLAQPIPVAERFAVTEWRLPATSPPFAAILFVPATWLPVATLKALAVVGNVLLLVLLVRLSWRFAARRPAAIPATLPLSVPVPVVVALGLWLEPVFRTVLHGEIGLALACLVLWDLTRPDHALGKGFAIGIAAGVELTPALFIAYLLLTGRPGDVRAGLTALASLIGTMLLGALVLPRSSFDFWTLRVFGTSGPGEAWSADNQSLQGLFARALHTPEPGVGWALACVVITFAGLWLARRAVVRAGHETWGVLATALTTLLVSPVSWSHHWVWCVPLLAVLLAEGRWRTAAAVALVFSARTFLLVPHEGGAELRLAWWQQVAASPYPLLALAVLAALTYGAYRHRHRRKTVPPLAPVRPLPFAQPPASNSSASTMR